jgi:hypothetical protein
MDIDQLVIEIESNTTGAEQGIDSLSASLGRLGALRISSSLSNQIKNINDQMARLTGDSLTNLTRFTDNMRSLVEAGQAKLSPTIARQIAAIGEAAGKFDVGKIAGITAFNTALSGLGAASEGLKMSGTIAKQITAIGEAARGLDASAINNLRSFSAALAPLAAFSGASLSGIAPGLKSLSGAARQAGAAAKGGASSFTDFAVKGFALYHSLRAVGNSIFDFLDENNKYVEDLNLFSVAMAGYGEEAFKYAQTVKGIMGIDPAEWLRGQGVMMTLTRGFGVTTESAAAMSKQLTQLSYDLSSFYNIKVEDAFLKMQSAVAGELEPLRRLGYDLSQAKLQEIAYANGIQTKVNAMTQAQKVQLRYHAIMTQVSWAQGDMARTLQAPANQLRVFQAQVTLAARAIGGVFIPALNAILPVAMAVVMVVRWLAESIASLFGYSLPEVDWSTGIGAGAGYAQDMEDALNGAGAAANKLKNITAGFDELHIISPDSGSGGPGPAGGGAGGDLGLNTPAYDFLAGLTEHIDEKFAAIRRVLETAFDNLKVDFGPAFDVAVGAIQSLLPELDRLGQFAGGALVDFYKSFLVPVGQWALGEGLPKLADIISGVLSRFDFTKLSSSLSGLWDTLAPFTIMALDTVLGLVGVLGDLSVIFINETLPSALSLLATAVNTFGVAALKALQDFYTKFLAPVGSWVLGNGLPELSRILQEMLLSINFDGLNRALGGLWDALAPFAINVGEGLLWFMDKVAKPLGVWTFNDALPTVINLLSAAMNAVVAAKDALLPAWDWLWATVVEPLGAWVGQAFVDGLNDFTAALQGVADWLVANPGLGEGIKLALTMMAETVTPALRSAEDLGLLAVLQQIGEALAVGALTGLALGPAGFTAGFSLKLTAGILIDALNDAGGTVGPMDFLNIIDSLFLPVALGILGGVKFGSAGLVAGFSLGLLITTVVDQLIQGAARPDDLLEVVKGLLLPGALAAIGGLKFGPKGIVLGMSLGLLLNVGIEEITKAVTQSVTNPVAEIGSIIVSGLAGVGAVLLGATGPVGLVIGLALWTSFKMGLWDGLKDVVHDMGIWVQGIIDKVKEFFGIHSPSTVFNDIGGSLVAGLLEGIGGAWGAITGFFATAIEAIKTGFSTGLDAVKGFFSDRWNDVKTIWGVASGWFSADVVEKIKAGFDMGLNAVKGFFVDRWGEVQAVWGVVSDWFSANVIEKVKSGFDTGLNAVKGFFTDRWNDIKAVWGAASGWFSTDVVEKIKAGFSTGVDAVKGFFASRWAEIQNIWQGAATWFGTNITAPIAAKFGAIKTDAMTSLNGLVDSIKTIGTQAKNGFFTTFSDIGTKMKTWGQNLLIQAKAALGINSPSKEFAKVGDYASAGFLNGVDESLSDIEAMFSDVLSEVEWAWSKAPNWFSINVATPLVETFQRVGSAIMDTGIDGYDTFTQPWGAFPAFLSANVETPLTDMLGALSGAMWDSQNLVSDTLFDVESRVSDVMYSIGDTVTTALYDAGSAFSDTLLTMQGDMDTFAALINETTLGISLSFEDMIAPLPELFATIPDAWANFGEQFQTDVVDTITSAMNSLAQSIGYSIDDIRSKMSGLNGGLNLDFGSGLDLGGSSGFSSGGSSSSSSSSSFLHDVVSAGSSASVSAIVSGAGMLGSAVAGAVGMAKSLGSSSKVYDTPSGALTAAQATAKVAELTAAGKTKAAQAILDSIPKKASGGLVERGQLFIANEMGPELVGSLGGHTAVANNDQIVQGIAEGVAAANGEQNVLLAEQNRLLRALLSKDTSVNLDGRRVNAMLDAKRRESGAAVFSGGEAFGLG